MKLIGMSLFFMFVAHAADDIEDQDIKVSCSYVSSSLCAAFAGAIWHGDPQSALLYWCQAANEEEELALRDAFFKALPDCIEKEMALFDAHDDAYRTNREALQYAWYSMLTNIEKKHSFDTYTAAFMHLVGEHVATFVYRYDEKENACKAVPIGEKMAYRIMHEKLEHLPVSNMARCYSPYTYETVAKQKNRSIFELGEDMCAIYDGEPERYGPIKGMIVVDTVAWRAYTGLQSAQKDKAAPRCALQ